MKTQVGYWMTKHPIKIDLNEDVKIAADIMKQETISHLLVFDSGWLFGILSNTDLELVDKIKKRFQGVERPPQITVGDLMSRSPVTISENAGMNEAIRIMKDKNFRSLPVINENNVVVGIITQTDVMRFALVASQCMDNHGSYSKIMSSA
ncbi:MAG: CBS domain-containing protein [Oligoflexia bacterium]|nr:CBS domain-containing protein [Oligoflexia bacterium]